MSKRKILPNQRQQPPRACSIAFKLIEYDESCFEKVHSHLLIPEIYRYLCDNIAFDRQQAKEVIQKYYQPGSELHRFWVVNIRDSEMAGLGGFMPYLDGVEFLVSLCPNYWGTGLADAVVLEIIRAWKQIPHDIPLYGRTDLPNRRSVSLMERTGFEVVTQSDEPALLRFRYHD